MLLPICVDNLEALHLQHKDEPFVGLSGEDLFDYIDALQKFRTRASSGNPVIYNCSNPGLCGRKFLFLLPHIPTVVSKPVLRHYRFGYVHMEICMV